MQFYHRQLLKIKKERNGNRMKKKSMRILAIFMAMLLMFTSIEITSIAAEDVTENIAAAEDCPETEESAVIAVTEDSPEAQETVVTEDSLESEDVIVNALEDQYVVYNTINTVYNNTAIKEGMFWGIKKDGTLVINGKGNPEPDAFGKVTWPWTSYADKILSADVTLSNFELANEMFKDLTNLKTIDISGMNTSKVIHMYGMFQNCSSLTELNFEKFDTSSVQSMYEMFDGCKSLKSLDVTGFDTSNILAFTNMFRGCSSLETLTISGINTSRATNMSSMFSGCDKLTVLDLSGFDTANVRDMSNMFNSCERLTDLKISSFNTAKVDYMNSMFSNCKRITTLNLSHFDTGAVKNMDAMFMNCFNLTSLDISKFNTSNTTTMSMMFASCNSLKSLDLSSFDMSNVTKVDGAFISFFSACNKLEKIEAPIQLKKETDLPSSDLYVWKDVSGNVITKLPLELTESITLTRCENTEPSATPSTDPSASPSIDPSASPSIDPSASPSIDPSASPSTSPSASPSTSPSPRPSVVPSKTPEMEVKLDISAAEVQTKDTFELNNLVDTALQKAMDTVIPKGVQYTGAKQTFLFDISFRDVKLAEGTDYSVKYKNAVNAGGNAQIEIKFRGDYKKIGTVTKTFTILPKNISDGDIACVDLYYEKGKLVKPVPVLYYNGKKLKAGKDYIYNTSKISFETTLSLSGCGNYSGTRDVKVNFYYKENRTLLTKAKVIVNKKLIFDGMAMQPEGQDFVVSVGSGKNAVILQKGIDYTVDFVNNEKPGTAVAVVKAIDGSANCFGEKAVTFKIAGTKLSKAKVTLTVKSDDGSEKYVDAKKGNEANYTGSAVEPTAKVEIIDSYGITKTLTEGVDYTISYKKNRKPGTATVTITGMGAYTGTKLVKFKIK